MKMNFYDTISTKLMNQEITIIFTRFKSNQKKDLKKKNYQQVVDIIIKSSTLQEEN